MRRPAWLFVAVVLIGLWAWSQRPRNGAGPGVESAASAVAARSDPSPTRSLPPTTPTSPASRYPDFLPREAHAVLDAIARGGPYAYRQDGHVFQNRERRLPAQPQGYYREYTVPTPGSRDRGPRRIVTGQGVAGRSPPREYWYSADHYRSFRRFDLDPPGVTR